jgi:predicted small lipoprotein YifL
MPPRTKFPLLAVIAALLLIAAGCGLKGPLYRPDEARPESVTPVPAPTSDEASGRKKESIPRSTQPNEQNEPPVSPPDPDRGAVPPPDL